MTRKEFTKTWVFLTVITLVSIGLKLLQQPFSLVTYFTPGPELLSEPWKLLLPTFVPNACGVRWSTTGLTLVAFMDKILSPVGTIYFLSAVVIITAFWCSWSVFQSRVFSYTMALCMAFGTQFNYAFVQISCVIYYLIITYALINLTSLHKIVAGKHNRLKWWSLFLISLVSLALSWETWLDYLVFLLIGSLYLWFALPKSICGCSRNRSILPAFSALIAGLGYTAVRIMSMKQEFSLGREADLLINYNYPVLIVEDLMSNVVTYMYIALTNYFPPFMIFSNSSFWLGSQTIIAEQHGYHEVFTHLVSMHHIFYWYMAAGAFFTMFSICMWKTVTSSIKTGDSDKVFLSLFMILIFFGSTTHWLIKYRPFLSVPIAYYKATFSILGVSLLVSYLLKMAWEKIDKPFLRGAIIVCVWLTIFFGAILRPRLQSHMAHLVDVEVYPDPLWGISQVYNSSGKFSKLKDMLMEIKKIISCNPPDRAK